jgi:hypothetical protein
MTNTALRRRIAPSVPLLIEFTDEKGPFRETYRLAFNLNVLANISEKTGLTGLDFTMWAELSAPRLRAMLWAAMLPYHPEYGTEEGLEVVGTMLVGENQTRAADALWEAYLLYLPAADAALMRQMRVQAEAGESPAGPLPAPAPATETPVMASPSDGSSSGPSVDLTSDSMTAKSAS